MQIKSQKMFEIKRKNILHKNAKLKKWNKNFKIKNEQQYVLYA